MAAFKLAASCIGWAEEDMDAALALLAKHGFAGVELAPTMVAGPAPYENLDAAERFAARAREEHGLAVPSLQSIWYGQVGSIFGPEAPALLDYTEGAARFAGAVGAHNLVFGCPKNRIRPQGESEAAALAFFKRAAGLALQNGCVLALEANPPVYGTNFMNTTPEAFAMARRVDSPGCGVNLDVGTMLINEEPVQALRGEVCLVNHVHISEPGLAPPEPRALHTQLKMLLEDEGYGGWISLEMARVPLAQLERALCYVAEVYA